MRIAGYGTPFNCVNVKKNQSAIVVGAGGLGNLAINALKNLGCKPVVAIDKDNKKLKFSKNLVPIKLLNQITIPSKE